MINKEEISQLEKKLQKKFVLFYSEGVVLHEKYGDEAMNLGLEEWNRLLDEYSPTDKPDDNCLWKLKVEQVWLEEWINLQNTGVHHFLRQLAKIPSGDVCCEKRILQIAYNLGQLVGSKALDGELQEFKDQVDVDRMLDLSNWIEL